jgi:hypothetical protein
MNGNNKRLFVRVAPTLPFNKRLFRQNKTAFCANETAFRKNGTAFHFGQTK